MASKKSDDTVQAALKESTIAIQESAWGQANASDLDALRRAFRPSFAYALQGLGRDWNRDKEHVLVLARRIGWLARKLAEDGAVDKKTLFRAAGLVIEDNHAHGVAFGDYCRLHLLAGDLKGLEKELLSGGS